MRDLKKNKQKVFYANPAPSSPILDEWGNETGAYTQEYGSPVELFINISAAQGENATREFGDLTDYDRTLATAKTDLPITEETVFWIDDLDFQKPHDYVVKKIAKSLNNVTYAVKKVAVQ